MKAILIDDEKASIEALKWELEPFNEKVEIIACFEDSMQALEELPTLSPDLVFLDIEMPNLNGFDLLRKLPSIPFEVIFTTAYDTFAVEAFKFSAMDYLLKPVDEDSLKRVLEKAEAKQKDSATQHKLEKLFSYLQSQNPDFPTIALPVLGGLEMVEVEKILYCESDSNYTSVHLEGDVKLLISKTLKEIEDLLNSRPWFHRVHHSYLVNLKVVRKYLKGTGGELVLKNGKHIPVSRRKKEELLKMF